MKYHIIFVALIIVVLFPSTSHAQITLSTAPPVTTITQNTHFETVATPIISATEGLFAISFSLTAFGNDIIIPTHAERNDYATTTDEATGALYNIYTSKGKRSMGGISLGFVYSPGEKTDGGYTIKKDTTRIFTVVGVYDNKGVVADTYHLRIDGIRYFIHDNQGTAVLERNGLHNYETESIFLKK